MARTLYLMAGMLFFMAACAAPPAKQDSAERADVLVRQAVVETVDLESRQILMTGQEGNRVTMVAGPEVRNLVQIEAGDVVRLAYYEAVAARIASPDDPGGAIVLGEAERAALGDKPGVAAAAASNLVLDFISYDDATAIATFATPDGRVQTARIHPKMREFAAARKSGDRIEVSIEQAIAISVEEIQG
ncbi:MAG: hypothetical protein AAGD13_24280 [Pseudomonadota bacterium]